MANKNLKKNRVTFVVADWELEEIKKNAELREMTISDYLREVSVKQSFDKSDLKSIRIGGTELHRGDNLKVTKDYGFYGEDSYITVDYKDGKWCLKDNENILLAKYLENHQADEEVSFHIISSEVK